ncbi:MAG: hypothetical protein IPN34_12450 [Planctomycetes bacterium]|nr:hypothetical protein [Planctomycetota bacterium]
MVTLAQLWLPILLGGVAVFFASFVLRCIVQHHKTDFQAIPDEAAAMEALRKAGVSSGQYQFPHCKDSKSMNDPAWQARWKQGPSGSLVVWPAGEMKMGRSMMQSTLFNIFGSFMAAYLATMVLAPGADRWLVLRFISTIGFLVYGGALVWGPIWKGDSWVVLAKELFDALVYGLVTGAVFVLLWP